MAHTETRAEHRTRKTHQLGSKLKHLVTIIAALRAWRRTVARRRAIADLTPYELKDIGYPETPRAMLDVKAGLITNLMSMR